MKDCFAFKKKVYEEILKKSTDDSIGAVKELLDYIEYGLYNRIPKDISIDELVFLQRSFSKRDILCADRVGDDELLSRIFKKRLNMPTV